MNCTDLVMKYIEDALQSAGLSHTVLTEETVLLETGLDSLGFAVLVAKLEQALGYDPFTIMDEPVYPETIGEFTAIYERYKEHARVV